MNKIVPINIFTLIILLSTPFIAYKSILAQDAEEQEEIPVSVRELQVPNSPVLNLLGVSSTEIGKPTMPKAFGFTSLESATNSEGSFPSTFGFEIGPYWWFSHPKLTFSDYYEKNGFGESILQSLSISVGATQAKMIDGEEEIEGSKVGIGLKTSLLAGDKHPQFDDKLDSFYDSFTICNAINSSTDKEECLKNAQKKSEEIEIIGEDRVGWQLDIANAYAFDAPDNDFGALDLSQIGVWLTTSYRSVALDKAVKRVEGNICQQQFKTFQGEIRRFLKRELVSGFTDNEIKAGVKNYQCTRDNNSGNIIFFDKDSEYDLNHLMSLGSRNDLPSKGKGLVIAAKIGDFYHVRIFDMIGNMAVDKGKDQLDVDDYEQLKKALDDYTKLKKELGDQSVDNQTKRKLIQKITSILDYCHSSICVSQSGLSVIRSGLSVIRIVDEPNNLSEAEKPQDLIEQEKYQQLEKCRVGLTSKTDGGIAPIIEEQNYFANATKLLSNNILDISKESKNADDYECRTLTTPTEVKAFIVDKKLPDSFSQETCDKLRKAFVRENSIPLEEQNKYACANFSWQNLQLEMSKSIFEDVDEKCEEKIKKDLKKDSITELDKLTYKCSMKPDNFTFLGIGRYINNQESSGKDEDNIDLGARIVWQPSSDSNLKLSAEYLRRFGDGGDDRFVGGARYKLSDTYEVFAAVGQAFDDGFDGNNIVTIFGLNIGLGKSTLPQPTQETE